MSIRDWLLAYALTLATVVVLVGLLIIYRRESRNRSLHFGVVSPRVSDDQQFGSNSTHRSNADLPRTDVAFGVPLANVDSHILRFNFEFGPHLNTGDLRRKVDDSLTLVENLVEMHQIDRASVERLSYRNPFELLLYVWAADAAVAALVGTAIGINGAVQHIRRSTAKTKAVEAEYKADELRHRTEQKVWEVLTAQIAEQDFDPLKIGQVAQAATLLRGVAYQPPAGEVRAIEPAQRSSVLRLEARKDDD